MCLFCRKCKCNNTTVVERPVDYDAALQYLIGLSRTEFDRIIKVSNIYRTANKNAAKILGVKDEPTTSIAEPIDESNDIPFITDEEIEQFKNEK